MTKLTGFERDRYLRMLFRQLPGGVWMTDRNLCLTYVVGRLANNMSPRAKPGMSIYDLVGTRDPANRLIAIHPRIIKGTYSLELCHYLDRRWHGSASPGAASEHTSTFAPIDEGSRARRVLPCGEATASRCAECGGPQQRRDRENSQIAAIHSIGEPATLPTTR